MAARRHGASGRRDLVEHRRRDILRVGLGRERPLRRDAAAALADLVAAQHQRARRAAQFRGEGAREGGLAGALQPAHRDDHRRTGKQMRLRHAQIGDRRALPVARRLHMRPDHRPQREERRQAPRQRRVAGARDVAVEHPVGRRPAEPVVEVHQQEGEIVAEVDRRQRLVELQRVERHRRAVPEAHVAEMQIAMRAADEALAGAFALPVRHRVERGETRRAPCLDRVGRQPGGAGGRHVALRDAAHRLDRVGPVDGWQALMEPRHRVGRGVKQRGRQPAILRDPVQEVRRRYPGHAQHPVDRAGCGQRNCQTTDCRPVRGSPAPRRDTAPARRRGSARTRAARSGGARRARRSRETAAARPS